MSSNFNILEDNYDKNSNSQNIIQSISSKKSSYKNQRNIRTKLNFTDEDNDKDIVSQLNSIESSKQSKILENEKPNKEDEIFHYTDFKNDLSKYQEPQIYKESNSDEEEEEEEDEIEDEEIELEKTIPRNKSMKAYSNFYDEANKSKFLKLKDLKNRYQSKIACLIRKKYTSLMKESIKAKSTVNITWRNFFSTISAKIVLSITGNILQAMISLLAVSIYVIKTYYDENDEDDKKLFRILDIFEYIVAGLVLFEWTYNFFKTNKKVKFLTDILNILDLVTAIPIMIQLFEINTGNLGFVRVFKIVRIMRIFRVYKVVLAPNKHDMKEEGKNETSRRLISAIISVLAMVFLSTGIVHYLNDQFPEYFKLVAPYYDTHNCQRINNTIHPSNETIYISRNSFNMSLTCPDGEYLKKFPAKISFDLAFYYMIITMSTVGYGDVYPATSWMRFVIGIFVIVSIVTISKQTSELNNLIKIDSEYQQPFKENNHVIVSGFFTKVSMLKFLNEFYHIDHKEKSENTKIVIIQPNYPDKDFQSILINPKYEEHLHFIYGDIFSEQVLVKANIAHAKAVFLLSTHDQTNLVKNDQFIILACKAISQASQAQIYAQLNFTQSLLHDWCDWDTACSTQQVKMSIIVKNGLIPGFATMIMNLISSSSNYYNSEVKDTPWLLEYIHGASQEIYVVKIPDYFNVSKVKISFHHFVSFAYEEKYSLIIGVKTKKEYHLDKDIYYCSFLMNPMNDYLLKQSDELIIICSDLDAAMSIFDTDEYIAFKTKNNQEFYFNHILSRINKNNLYENQNVNQNKDKQNDIVKHESIKEKDKQEYNHSKGPSNIPLLNNEEQSNLNKINEESIEKNEISNNSYSGKESSNGNNGNNKDKIISSVVNNNKPFAELVEQELKDFFTLFKFESDNINMRKNLFENMKENKTPKIDIDLIENNKVFTDTFINEIKFHEDGKKLSLPPIFQNKQTFKIWENNLNEFTRHLQNHFVVFCKEDMLFEFMNCFDQHNSSFVFFVSDQSPTQKWEIIKRYYCNLIHVECCYSDIDDLEKLNLNKAKHVYILTWEVENSNVKDSGILPLVKMIEENFPNCKYTLELSDELNVRYLSSENSLYQNDLKTIYKDKTTTMFSGTKNNRETIKKKIIKKKNQEKLINEKIPFTMWPKYAKSDIFFSSSLDSLMAFTFHNEGLLDVLTKLLGISQYEDEEYLENNELTTFRYVGTERYKYSDVFVNFMRLNYPIIPIAIYRRECDDDLLQNKSHYIITNPKKDLLLNPQDEIICIGQPEIGFFEKINDEEAYDTNESGSDESSEDPIEVNVEKIPAKKSEPKEKDLVAMTDEEIISKIQEELNKLKKFVSTSTKSKDSKAIKLLNSNTNEFIKSPTILKKGPEKGELKSPLKSNSIKLNENENNFNSETKVITGQNIVMDEKVFEEMQLEKTVDSIVSKIDLSKDVYNKNSLVNNFSINIQTKNEFKGNNITITSSGKQSKFKDLLIKPEIDNFELIN